MCQELLLKLIDTYPADAASLTGTHESMCGLMQLAPEFIVKQFYKNTKDLADVIKNADDKFFIDNSSSLPIFGAMDMRSNWEASPKETQAAIWSYLQSLFDLARSHNSITADGVMIDTGDKFLTDTVDLLAQKESMQYVTDMSNSFRQTFVKENGREPTKDDDIGKYSADVAKKMGINLNDFASLDLSTLQDQLTPDNLPSIPGLPVESAEEMSKFVLLQMQNLQKHLVLEGQKKNVAE
jgi:hypothetical protein